MQDAPKPQIRLSWPFDVNNDNAVASYDIYRKLLSDTTWSTTVVTGLAPTTTSYADDLVTVDTPYEYMVVGHLANTKQLAYGLLATGIDLSLVDNRGTVILLVEENMGSQLTDQLETLISDLICDGWTVIRHDVSSHRYGGQAKALVNGDYNSNANVKALFIFGNVPVPRSGWNNPFPDNFSYYLPFPTDLYYGIIGGNWTDTQSFGTGTEAQPNQPHDGIFDQNTVMDVLPGNPAPVTLEVGRVDLSNLPAFDDRRHRNQSPEQLPDQGS